MVGVTAELIAGDAQASAAAQDDIFRVSGGHCHEGKRYQGQNRGQKGPQAHSGASRRAKCSMAAATPSSSLEPVICQPRAFNSDTPFAITTGMPTKDSISRSLWLSPMARMSSRGIPRRAAHSASVAPLETAGLMMS